ncbi:MULTISPECIES: dermonecrotic toxin domain-containing protein [unclassified Pseudomonas]|uniref:dermonecrotic toxin domain-containing protein n=1 Tax=unclassified Pseudomonas TaxID=196821 RepID=UPI0025D1AA20|nr:MULTISPECIES: DUF6543 domain-containing protein [unclassified Pseudomonas]
MPTHFDLIDTFSHRPSLSPLALDALHKALVARYPALDIHPDRAVITGEATPRTLFDHLRINFSTGKTPRWVHGQNTLVADPGAPVAQTLDVDIEQLAVLVDTVSLALPETIMRALVDFWDRPDQQGMTPWKRLAEALESQPSSAYPATASGMPPVLGAQSRPAAIMGGYYERKALEALDAQLLAIQGVLTFGLEDFDEIERYLARITDIRPLLHDEVSARLAPRVSRLEQLPVWLSNASSADRLDYSRRMSALAVVTGRAAGQAWNDDLPPILDYAGKAMQDAMRHDHPEATRLTLDDVTVHIAKVVAVAAPLAGQIIPVGSVENLRMSVATFALQNLSSLPNGALTFSIRDGGPLPGWFTPDYLKQLVGRVNVGCNYPDRVRHYLITDHAQAARRRGLFAEQLRVQLPLKALEQKIRGQGGLTQAGYRLVCSLLTSAPALGINDSPRTESVLRPLAWIAEPDAAADEVSNMFVIADADPAVGPLILYRPFAAVPLTEFADWTSLRQAIVAPGELQDEVLTWMSSRGRQRYANGGFAQPHIVRFGLGSDFAALRTPGPAQLSTAHVQGDPLTALFDANARALVDLADRESVSNAESRWAMLQRGGWLALDAVMPFISGSVGSALWLVQLMAGVDQVLVAESRKARREATQAWNGLLLTISMILLHQGFALRAEAGGRSVPLQPSPAEPGGQPVPTATQASAPVPVQPEPSRTSLLDFSWSNSNHRLTEAQARHLERLKVSPESACGTPSTEPGREGLYRQGEQWRVRLDSGVYAVGFSDDAVFIVDPQDPLSEGPRLRQVAHGWALDLSLGLRGGGPKRTARMLAQENAAKLKRVTERGAALAQRRQEIYQRLARWDVDYRASRAPLTAEVIKSVEADLNELIAILEEHKQLQQSLRPADRFGEKATADDLKSTVRRIAFFEGVVLERLLAYVRVEFPRLSEDGEASVNAGNIDAYLILFNKVLTLTDLGVHWSGVRYGFWEQLRAVPKVGERYWHDEVLEMQRCNLYTHLEWRINRMWSLLELSLRQESILAPFDAAELKALRIDAPLHAACSSHAELEKPNDYTVSEQIDVLESSVREYQRGLTIATCTQQNTPELLIVEQFERFVDDLSKVTEQAEKRLSDLIRESAEPQQHALEYAPKVKQPGKRVFRTRNQRTLVGRLREGEPDFPGEVVDVTQSMGDKVVSTYHLHENGDWVEVETVHPATHHGHEHRVALAELAREASAALARVGPDILTVQRQAQRGGEPADMQDILVQKARRLTELADKIAAQGGESAAAKSTDSPVQAQLGELRLAASRLEEEGRNVRIAMIKTRPPTAARLSYLAAEREVNIARFEGRKNMSGSRRNDFLQEYLIRDSEMRVLWWAHFHYASEGAAADAFTAAHLKLPDQRFVGYKAQLKAARNNKEVISVYRSYIGKDVARRLFLDLNPVAASDR